MTGTRVAAIQDRYQAPGGIRSGRLHALSQGATPSLYRASMPRKQMVLDEVSKVFVPLG